MSGRDFQGQQDSGIFPHSDNDCFMNHSAHIFLKKVLGKKHSSFKGEWSILETPLAHFVP